MPLQSIGNCPWCAARVDMKKVNGAFQCPVCNCRYRHNWAAWFVGIPLALGIAGGVFMLLHIALFAAGAGAVVAISIVSKMGLYRVIAKGSSEVTDAVIQAHVPDRKESRWIIIVMILLLAVIAAVFYIAMRGE